MDPGGYTFKMILLLWGIAALTYGISRFFFIEAFELCDGQSSLEELQENENPSIFQRGKYLYDLFLIRMAS